MDKKTKMFIIQTNQAFHRLVTVVQTQENSSQLTSPWTREVCSFLTGIEITFLTPTMILSKVDAVYHMWDHTSVSFSWGNEFHSCMAGHVLPEGDEAAHSQYRTAGRAASNSGNSAAPVSSSWTHQWLNDLS